QVPAVGRTERHGMRRPELADGVARTLEHRLLGRRESPDLHQPVGAGGGEVPAIGMKGDAARRNVVRPETLDDPTRSAVPDLDLAVLARGCDPLAVGTERYPINFGRVLQDQW